MLQIQINNEFLDLPDDITMDVEENNPFLQFNEEIIGTYSFPFNVLATDKNLRLLGYKAILQVKNDTNNTNAIVFDGGLTVAKGTIRVEQADISISNTGQSVISCYFLSSGASFYQDIKDKKLRDIDAGGNRTFDGDNASPWYNSEFGVHVLNVAKGITTTDYTFFPVKNSIWGTDPGMTVDNDVMNKVYQTESGMTIGPLLVPFPRLKYILLQAIAYTGWTIEGDILDDDDFEKICIINFRAIDWATYRAGGGSTYFLDPKDTVTFNLKDHIPNWTIGQFIIALKNRFGWWYDFDAGAKKIKISILGDLPSASIKSFAGKINPLLRKTFLKEQVIYALRNNFITNTGEGIDLTKLNYQGVVDDIAALPAAAQALNEHVYLVEEENNYYACLQDPANETIWLWERISPNIYDYVPAGATEDITTSATTVGMIKFDNYMDFIPECEGQGVWTDFDAEGDWGLHLAFWIGFGDRKLGSSGGFAYKYPQAIHHCYSTLGTQVTNWSLAFKGQLNDATQAGLYDLNWKAFLDILNTNEEVTAEIYLNLHELLNLSFKDIINLEGVKLFIKTKRVRYPYKGSVELLCTRIV